MSVVPNISCGRVLAALAFVLLAVLIVPQTAHAHSDPTDKVFAEDDMTASNHEGELWALGHCDDGPTCAGAKSLLVAERLSAPVFFARKKYILKTEIYRGSVPARDPPVPILIL